METQVKDSKGALKNFRMRDSWATRRDRSCKNGESGALMKCIECFDEHICILVDLSMWLANSYHEFLFILASRLMLS